MRTLPIVACCAVAMVVGAWAASAWHGEPSAPLAADDGLRADVEALRGQLAALGARLDASVRARPLAVEAPRADAAAIEGHAVPRSAPERDALWYLDQYVRSFADDPQGVEYYRLAVAAHVVELVDPITALVRDANRPVPLRFALVDMLGRARFADSLAVIDALLAAVRPPAPEPLALRALQVLAALGSANALPGLEAAIPALAGAVRERAIALLAELGGDAANAALLRLFLAAADDGLRLLLVRHLGGSDVAAALELLRAAAGGVQVVRLEAARKVGEFDEPEFDPFVTRWREVETDAQVLAALGGAGAAAASQGWSAQQAIGPPDADRTRDDPNAWAPKSPEMGRQWLQLTYATPMRANGVRIFDVNAPGAVAEVAARGTDGGWVTLWRGTAAGADGPLVITFPLTAFAVRSLRLVLDTDRTPGWNEIDAVELLGPGGGQWAARARASSSYGGAVATHDPRNPEILPVQFLQGARR